MSQSNIPNAMQQNPTALQRRRDSRGPLKLQIAMKEAEIKQAVANYESSKATFCRLQQWLTHTAPIYRQQLQGKMYNVFLLQYGSSMSLHGYQYHPQLAHSAKAAADKQFNREYSECYNKAVTARNNCDSIAKNIKSLQNALAMLRSQCVQQSNMPKRKRSFTESTAEAEHMELSTNSAPKRRRTNPNGSGIGTNQKDQHQNNNTGPGEERNQSPMDVFGGKDPWEFTMKELKELCRSKGLKVGGNKPHLINRLLNPTSAESRKGGKRTSQKQVHTMLRNAGIADPEKVNKCLKRGIQSGYYVIDGPDSLDTVILEGDCDNCKKKLVVTIRDALYQQSVGDDYCRKDNGGAVHCGGDDDLCYRQYITELCVGSPGLDCGKFHNHCEECPGFGYCIGDYREAHCGQCGRHWFAGSRGQFPCSCGATADRCSIC